MAESGAVLFRLLLSVRPASEILSDSVVGVRTVLLFAIVLILLLVFFLEHFFDLLLQSHHRSLPFRLLANLILAPGPELVMLLLGEESINLWGVPLFLQLEVLWKFPSFPLLIGFVSAALQSGDVPLLTLLKGSSVIYCC